MVFVPVFWNKKPQAEQSVFEGPRYGGKRRKRRPAEDVWVSDFPTIGTLAYTNLYDVSANVFSINSLISQGYLQHRMEIPSISILARTQETRIRSCLTHSKNPEIRGAIQQRDIYASIGDVRRHVPYKALKDAVAVLLIARLNNSISDEDK